MIKNSPHSKKIRLTTSILLIVSLLFVTGCRTKAPTAAKANYNGVVLNYYKVFDSSEILDPIIRQYETDHPGLKINYRQFADFTEYQRVVLNEMAEGGGPDIFSMQNTWFMSNYKKLIPMPITFGTPNDFGGTFVDVAYNDLVRPDKDGVTQVYGMPMTVDTLALYYNKAQVEDRLASKGGKPSKTWEGIKDDVIQLNKSSNSLSRFEVSGIAAGRADNISRGVDTLYLLMLQYGTKFYNDNFSEASFAGQQGGLALYPGIEAVRLFVSFADSKQRHYSWNEYVVSDPTGNKEVDAFAKGQVSMIFGYAYTYDDIVKAINSMKDKGGTILNVKDIGIAPAPQLFDPSVSKNKRVAYASYFAEAVSRNSKHPDIAWDFLIELTKKKNLDYYFNKTHKPTSRRDMIEDQRKDPVYGVFADQVAYAESFPILDYSVYKDLFTTVITKANLAGVGNSALLDAQTKVTEMLPPDGLVVPKAVVAPVDPKAKTKDLKNNAKPTK
ncbi:MAG: extracellular solute-binding protein [Candidatus Peregrinibacteria bacterium]|nr:extracellular solute-binding protein [Candidatus Peregrinibacteria bacterium]